MGISDIFKKKPAVAPLTAVFTRMAYVERIEPERIEIYREVFLKSLRNQIYTNFDVYIITGGVWGQESTPENTALIKKQDTNGLNIFYRHMNEIPENTYNIQIRVDCDDYIAPGFILKCLDIYRNTNRNCFVITFRPYKYDYTERKIYKVRRGKWSDKPSMFTALCQKEKIKHFVYDRRHTRLTDITKKVVFVEDGFCAQTVHGKNRLSRIKNTDTYLCKGNI
jgi:hypothetical protein